MGSWDIGYRNDDICILRYTKDPSAKLFASSIHHQPEPNFKYFELSNNSNVL